MKCIWLVAVACLFFAGCALPITAVKAQNTNDKPFAAAQTSKQQRANACRARYRDCLKLKQIPSFECRTVYSDCRNSII